MIESKLEAEYVAGRRVYEINQGEYQNMLTLEELEAIVRDARAEHAWLVDLIKEWLS